jgi:DNA-directed RNA polymerase subunit A'
MFSLLLPEDFSITYNGKMQANKVVVEKGKLTSGVMDSEGMAGKLLNELYVKYGSDVAREFIDKSTRLAIRSLMKYGFTVGIDEQDIPKDAKNKLVEVLNDTEKKVDDLINAYHRNELKVIPGKSIEESLEQYIMVELGQARGETGKIAAKYAGENSAVLMAKTGARGSLLNLTQMSGSVGQQAVRGQRINRGYYKRTLSHFKKGDVSAGANGFVRSNFKRGLTPTEYFFHSMGGREGLVDTAIRTGRSGYMQRRLVNALQDLVVYPDLTVRGDGGVIIQFRYGEDGIDPMKRGYME